MPTNTVRSSYDTFIAEPFPDQNFADWRQLNLTGGTGDHRYGFVYFGGMPPQGAVVSSALLRVWLRRDWAAGTHTVTVKRVTSSWKESKLTWNRAGSAQIATATHAASATVTGGPGSAGTRVELDVTGILGDIAAGQPWYGLRLEVDTGLVKRVWSSEADDPHLRPQLVVEWSRPPLAPSDLAPSGGRAVSIGLPTLGWVFKDREGDEQAAYQVQVAVASDTQSDGSFTAPEYDSGWVTSGDTEHDLAGTAYAGVPDGGTRYWLVRTQDVNGLVSDWSDPVAFTRTGKGTLTVGSPLDGGTVEETTPPVTTTSSTAQDAVAYRLDEDDGTGRFTTIWEQARTDAPAAAGVAYSFAVPKGHIKRSGRNYRIRVRSWDAVDREATPGDPTYVQAYATFTFARSAVPAPVTSLTVAEEAPGVRLTFHRAAGVAQPDYFALLVDGVRVFDRVDPALYSLGGDPIVYELVWYGATSRAQHTFEVEAVVADAGALKHSQGNASVTYTPDVAGVWLVDDDDPPYSGDALPRRVRLLGKDAADLAIGESSAVFYPVGRRGPVRIVDAIRGLEGTITGTVRGDDPAGQWFIENLRWMKDPDRVGRRIRLVTATDNIPVELGEASFSPTRRGPDREYAVSVQVAQIDEFDP